MDKRINLFLYPADVDRIQDALREVAHYADKTDKLLELIGEIQAQITIDSAYKKKYDDSLFSEAKPKKRIEVRQSKMNDEKLPKSFRHKTGTRYTPEKGAKPKGQHKYAEHVKFIGDAF
jgi:hypothetical protein